MTIVFYKCCDVVRDWITMDNVQAVMNKYNNSKNNKEPSRSTSAPIIAAPAPPPPPPPAD